jgi:hypothetical protein
MELVTATTQHPSQGPTAAIRPNLLRRNSLETFGSRIALESNPGPYFTPSLVSETCSETHILITDVKRSAGGQGDHEPQENFIERGDDPLGYIFAHSLQISQRKRLILLIMNPLRPDSELAFVNIQRIQWMKGNLVSGSCTNMHSNLLILPFLASSGKG